MNEAKRKYKRKCKVKTITFYLHESVLYEYANKINFTKLVKDTLRKEAMKNGNL